MIITICGSKKFANHIYELQSTLRELGNTVYAPMFNVDRPIDELVQVHRYKILASDCIIVYNLNGYIGEHTKDEIKFADKFHKPIFYTDQLS